MIKVCIFCLFQHQLNTKFSSKNTTSIVKGRVWRMFPGKGGGGGGRVFLAGGGLKHEVGRWPLADLSPNHSMYYQFRARKTKSQVVAELFSAVYNLKISFQPDEIEMSIKRAVLYPISSTFQKVEIRRIYSTRMRLLKIYCENKHRTLQVQNQSWASHQNKYNSVHIT